MTPLRRGVEGSSVRALQQRLEEMGYTVCALDGQFGANTEQAVRQAQVKLGLPSTGVVDAATWRLLFPGVGPGVNGIRADAAPLAARCLALTGSFETGTPAPDCFSALAGDFDGMGLSFGALQWNLGQGTLQPLLAAWIENHPDLARDLFREHLGTISALGKASLAEQLSFSRSIQTPRGQICEPWRGLLKSLGSTDTFRDIQQFHSQQIYTSALSLALAFGLSTERGTALCFDVMTQNGWPNTLVKADIVAALARTGKDDEVARMTVIANRIAAASRPQYAADVLSRKLTIANGRGTVHGIEYNLDDYGITLAPRDAPASVTTPQPVA